LFLFNGIDNLQKNIVTSKFIKLLEHISRGFKQKVAKSKYNMISVCTYRHIMQKLEKCVF